MSELTEKLKALRDYLRTHIRGQDHVVDRMCSVVTRGELGLQPADQPKGSVLFLGPTGVGKTELTKQIAKFIFGKELLYTFDMSEFLHLDQVKLFIGDESGQTGRLGIVLSHHREGILLFDEIEKAHNLISDLFLQMIGAARITLPDHKAYDLSGFYIVCTSNIGSEYLRRPSRLPFVRLESSVLGKVSRAIFLDPVLVPNDDYLAAQYRKHRYYHRWLPAKFAARRAASAFTPQSIKQAVSTFTPKSVKWIYTTTRETLHKRWQWTSAGRR